MRTLAPVVCGIDTVNLALHFGDVAFEAGVCGHEMGQPDRMGITVQEKDFGNEVRVSRERMREVLFRYAVVGFEFCFLCERDSGCRPTHRNGSEIVHIHFINLYSSVTNLRDKY